jgi:hypothetical protein
MGIALKGKRKGKGKGMHPVGGGLTARNLLWLAGTLGI